MPYRSLTAEVYVHFITPDPAGKASNSDNGIAAAFEMSVLRVKARIEDFGTVNYLSRRHSYYSSRPSRMPLTIATTASMLRRKLSADNSEQISLSTLSPYLPIQPWPNRQGSRGSIAAENIWRASVLRQLLEKNIWTTIERVLTGYFCFIRLE